MLLNGITGFYDRKEDEPPIMDSKEFKRFCFQIARLIGERVIFFTKPHYPSNYYEVKLSNDLYILLNAHYPYIAFADFVEDSKVNFINDSSLHNACSAAGYQVLTVADLHTPLKIAEKTGQLFVENRNSLNEAEIAQIKNWKPKTVGEVIYNCWD
ncbi:hypothetical protein J2Z40_003868 [Cytobacillus eiseniae]|uniref:Uncharacterized protein n=1 Tax=Cytobacillus eiseniae TaxID=762947 RepID=A0ABS4RLV8_9BACI|nr:hypothetical protein [Cytobacillus eiseniae]MBP2243269.1 hypothetical protein [Cytobacillus eiseniae]